MGKTEDMKAMKAARAAEWARSGAVAKPAPAARPAMPALVVVPDPVPAPAAGVLCDHRAISGKRCIREKGHEEVDHKYAKTPAR